MDQLDLFQTGDTMGMPGGWQPTAPPVPPGLLLGSCAWNHASFDRHFYPAGLPSARQLAYYARVFNAVEVDSTFYGVPSPGTVDRWRDAVGPHFRFAIKVPRAVTHDGSLQLARPEVRAAWQDFVAIARRLGGQLSAVLLQLPPGATILHFERLRAIASEATAEHGLPLVIEFRHTTWNCDEVTDWLREHRIVRAWVDQYNDGSRGVARTEGHLLAETGAFRYVRLLGDTSNKYNNDKPTGRNFEYGSVLFDRTADLDGWCELIRRDLAAGLGVQLSINNHYQGFTPITAEQIRTRLSAPGAPEPA